MLLIEHHFQLQFPVELSGLPVLHVVIVLCWIESMLKNELPQSCLSTVGKGTTLTKPILTEQTHTSLVVNFGNQKDFVRRSQGVSSKKIVISFLVTHCFKPLRRHSSFLKHLWIFRGHRPLNILMLALKCLVKYSEEWS